MGTSKKKLKVVYLEHLPPVFDSKARNVVYVKGRRAGGTHGAVKRLIEIAHEEQTQGSRHLWVDTVHRNIERYVERYFLPGLKGTRFKWNKSRRVLRFQGGSLCDFGSAQRPETLEGFGYDYIWLNEAGTILRDPAIYYQTLLPMMLEARNAQFFIIGAPKGGGLFKQMYEWGQQEEEKQWISFRHASDINPLLSRTELEYMREHMPERTYRQEILAEFVDEEGAVFRDVRRIATAQPEQAASAGIPYVMGLDLARYHDYSVVWVGRADIRAGVFCDRFRRIPWRIQAERIAAISRRYNDAVIYADATGAGDPVVEDLKRGGLAVEGVVMTAGKKQQLVDGLAMDIEQERLTIFPHEITLAELEAYEITLLPSGHGRTSAPPGKYDDCVMALALLNWGMSGRGGEFILGERLVISESDW